MNQNLSHPQRKTPWYYIGLSEEEQAAGHSETMLSLRPLVLLWTTVNLALTVVECFNLGGALPTNSASVIWIAFAFISYILMLAGTVMYDQHVLLVCSIFSLALTALTPFMIFLSLGVQRGFFAYYTISSGFLTWHSSVAFANI